MTQYFEEYGPRLAELGYTVLPIKPGTKRPDLKNWNTDPPNLARVKQGAVNGWAKHGTGVHAAHTPLIDVDVLDPEIADQMSRAIDSIFPDTPLMTRTGLAPKFGVPMRSDTPFKKLTSKVYTDGTREHKVEILGDGQQWVAYADHPDTGRPYVWFDGLGDEGIVGTPLAALPEITREDALRVVGAFEVLAAERVAAGLWRAVSAPSVERDRPVVDDPFAAHAPPTDLTRAQVEWLLSKCDASVYARWIDAGMAIHHQYGGSDEGFEIWDAWSATAGNYEAKALPGHWESFGHRTDAPLTMRGLIKEHGQPPAPRVHAAHPEATEADPVPFVEGSQFSANFEDIDWLVEDVVPRAQVGVIYGASGSGKTFFALDMACAVHRGLEWRGKHVERADTFYIAAEAGNGIKKRIAAYLQQKGDGAMPWFVDYQPNIATLDSVHAISQSIKLRSGNAGLIFLDTLALSHDGDENSSKDMSLVLRHCKVLSDDTGALVVLVHHTGKDESKGMRGSSSLYAGADFVLEIMVKGRDHTMYVDKLKDGERGAQFGFTLPSVEVGTTPRGKSITSCYVKECDAKLSRAGRKPLTVEQQIFIFDVFQGALGMAADMSETELVEAVREKQREADNTPSQAQSIKKSIAKMIISGHITIEKDRLSLPHSGHSGHSASSE